MTTSLVIQALEAFGTLLIAALAIWGNQIAYYLAGPKLRIRLEASEGAPWIPLSFPKASSAGVGTEAPTVRAKYYHLRVWNLRPHALAQKVRVVLVEIRRPGPDGTMQRDPALTAPIQFHFQWAKQPNNPDFHDAAPTIGTSHRLADIGMIREDKNFQLTTYVHPNNLDLELQPNKRLQFVARAEAENALSNELVIDVSWDGERHDGLAEMARHLVVTDLSKPA
jgi:hypothetical protein